MLELLGPPTLAPLRYFRKTSLASLIGGDSGQVSSASSSTASSPIHSSVVSEDTASESAISIDLNGEDKSKDRVVEVKFPGPANCDDKIFKKIFNTFFDFELPYDIFVQHVENQETGGRFGMTSSTNLKNLCKYKKARQNLQSEIKAVSNIKAEACDCKVPYNDKTAIGCGTDCLNRAILAECDAKTCPCGERCSNQRMQKHEWSPGLERFMTLNRGWGVRTTEPIKKGDFILEYIGEVVTKSTFNHRMATEYLNDPHHYCLSLDSSKMIDGYRVANEGRFVNHSCEPNCEMQKWSVNGYYRVSLFALRDIRPGEELSYDYNFDNFNSEMMQSCRCGSKNCRGVIGGKRKGSLGSERRNSTDSGGNKPPVKKRKSSIKSALLPKIEEKPVATSTDLITDELMDVPKDTSKPTTVSNGTTNGAPVVPDGHKRAAPKPIKRIKQLKQALKGEINGEPQSTSKS